MSQPTYFKVPIKGMHCRSCELLIEEKLQSLPQVKEVEIDYKTGEAIVYHDGSAPSPQLISQAIKEAGYEVGASAKLPWLTRDKKEYIGLGVAFLFLVVFWLVLKFLGLNNISFGSNLSSPGWGLIMMVGLVAGFSTCMALVGGLVLGLSAKFVDNHPNATSAEKFKPHLYFGAGRILFYALFGGLLGALGTVFQFSSTANAVLTILVAVVMLVMGLQLINIFPRLNNFKLSLPKSLGRSLGLSQINKKYSHENAIIMGGLTFFLPCGFTQAMQLYAVSTGDFKSGALVMGLFALGTAPGLLSIGGVSSLVRGVFKERFFKVAGLAVIGFALFNLNNGYTLAGLSLGHWGDYQAKTTKVVSDPNVTLIDGVQVVRMTESNSGYAPNKFSLKRGVPVKWIIDAKAPYSCASSLLVPKLNLRKNLQVGENIIEFTPTEVGKIPFSCSMGMYTGTFNIYDDEVSDNSQSSSQNDDNNSSIVNTSDSACNVDPSTMVGTGGGCGCGGGVSGGCGGSCGGGAPAKKNTTETVAKVENNAQNIEGSYDLTNGLQPNNFIAKVGKPVHLVVRVKEDGQGCMSTIMVQNYTEPELLRAGQTIVMDFTPIETGNVLITCAMGVPHGFIKVL